MLIKLHLRLSCTIRNCFMVSSGQLLLTRRCIWKLCTGIHCRRSWISKRVTVVVYNYIIFWQCTSKTSTYLHCANDYWIKRNIYVCYLMAADRTTDITNGSNFQVRTPSLRLSQNIFSRPSHRSLVITKHEKIISQQIINHFLVIIFYIRFSSNMPINLFLVSKHLYYYIIRI